MSNAYEHNPLSEHYQNMRTDPEGVLVEQARKGKWVTGTALNAFGLARKWADVGMKLPVFRDYNLELFAKDDNGKVRYPNAQSVWDYMRRVCDENAGERRVLFNISCEMDMTPALYSAYIQLMDLSAKSGSPIGMVFSNAAWLPSYWDKQGNHYKQAMALAYLNKLHEMSGVKLQNGMQAFWHGDHQYTSGYWCAFSNEGQFLGDPKSAFSDKWKTGEYVIDWSKKQWHLGAKFQAIMDALGWQWNHPSRQWVPQDGKNPQFKLPGTIISESLFGSMSIAELLAAFPNWKNTAPWNRDIRGYRANTEQWAVWYPELYAQGGVGRVLTEMRVQTWQHLWLVLKMIAGDHHFARGNTGGWDADNTTGDKGYQDSIVNVRLPIPIIDGTTPPPPQPDPEEPRTPAPDDTRWQPFIATPIGGTARIRSRSNTQSVIVGTVAPPNANLFHIPFDALNATERVLARPDGNYQWHVVKLQSGIIGWMREDVVNLFAVITEPEPPLLVREIYEQWLGEMKSSLQDSAFVLSEVEAAHALIETQVERLDALKVWEVARRDRTAAQVKLIETILSNMED